MVPNKYEAQEIRISLSLPLSQNKQIMPIIIKTNKFTFHRNEEGKLTFWSRDIKKYAQCVDLEEEPSRDKK